MTVNETYFFREEYQLKCMIEPVLDEIVRLRRGRQPIRIWSIPCSTGEEPYSIALYLLEYWPLIEEVDVELIASHIDTEVLEKCRAGVFGARSVQNLPRNILLKHFTRLSGDRYQISEDLRSAVDFDRVNVSDPIDTQRMRGLDIIYCRNLLIYFDDASRWQAIEAFYDALNPGGFLFLGHAESISRTSSLFRVRKFDDAIAYQKPLTRRSWTTGH